MMVNLKLELMAEIVEHNLNNKPHLMYTPDMNRLRMEAIVAINPNYRLQGNKKTIAEKNKIKKIYGARLAAERIAV